MSLILGEVTAFSFPPVHLIFWLVGILLILLIIGIFTWLRSRSPLFLIWGCLVLMSWLIGVGLSSYERTRVDAISIIGGIEDRDDGRSCDGFVLSDPVRTSSGARVDVELVSCRRGLGGGGDQATGKVRLMVYGGDAAHENDKRMETIEEGDQIRFFGKVSHPHDFRNPGGFSYRRYLATQGIGAVVSISDPAMVVRRGGEAPDVQGWFSRFRRSVVRSIDASVDGSAAVVLKAVAVGWREGVEHQLREHFSRTGIAHILSISGLHIGFLAAIAVWLVVTILCRFPRCFVRFPLWYVAWVVTLPIIWGYVMLSGMAVAAVRSALMFSILLLGLFVGRRREMLSSLSLACLLIVILWPLAIYDISFQLSAISVLGIVTIAPKIVTYGEQWFQLRCKGWRARFLQRAVQLVAVTFAATLASAPLVAYHFHLVTALGLVANLVAVPLAGIPLLTLTALGVLLTVIAPAFAAFAWKGAAFVAGMITWIAERLASMGSPLVFHVAPTFLELVLVYAVLLTVLCWQKLPFKRILVISLCAAICFDGFFWHGRPLTNHTLEVTCIDVGQGDAIVVKFPDGAVWLVDGGGLLGSDFDVGEHVVAPVLWSMGIHHLEALLLTHPHHDHYRGLRYIAQEFSPKVAFGNGAEAPTHEQDEWQRFKQGLADHTIPFVTLSAESPSMQRGGVEITLLHPRLRDVPRLGTNDGSLVLSLRYGDIGILLTGDLGAVGEERLIDEGMLRPHQVLKVGHHGSRTSSTASFLKAVRPKFAVISVGDHNRYGLPDEDVLRGLSLEGAEILRTDRQGAVTIVTDGKRVETRTFIERRSE